MGGVGSGIRGHRTARVRKGRWRGKLGAIGKMTRKVAAGAKRAASNRAKIMGMTTQEIHSLVSKLSYRKSGSYRFR
jgi:hypothetical protein